MTAVPAPPLAHQDAADVVNRLQMAAGLPLGKPLNRT